MIEATKRGAREGIGFGILAGILFAIVEIAVAAMMGNPPLTPLRMFASVLLGEAALETATLGMAFIVGTIVHVVLSAIYGLIYGVINASFSAETQTRWGPQIGIGLLYGVALWFVNFQVIARILYPWFLEAPQFLQMVLHAVFFGLPLALMVANAERRVHHLHHRAPLSL